VRGGRPARQSRSLAHGLIHRRDKNFHGVASATGVAKKWLYSGTNFPNPLSRVKPNGTILPLR
jgi:hypothetical protein